MFTCISCRAAFETADEQRSHFATDWHRYNMKRRVANLPPVAAAAFNEKVIERREQNAVRIDPRDLFCDVCSKGFSTENAYRSHVQSKKHKERDSHLKREQPMTSSSAPGSSPVKDGQPSNVAGDYDDNANDEDEDEDEEDEIEARLAASRRRIQPSHCLFCQVHSRTIDDNFEHMSRFHSFFVPDRELLLDPAGLLSYLGEKVVLGNLCLFCPNGGKEFGDVAAVRKHMVDKSHCKLAYETDEDRAELADFYDFGGDKDSDWEEVDEDIDGTEEGHLTSASHGITLAPDGLSLLLPSGRTLGHRSLRVYYQQKLRPFSEPTDNASRLKLMQVRSKLADPTLALIPVAGGQGAFGRGLQVMKARNAGEAKWAKRQASTYKDQRAKAAKQIRIGFVGNNQKHFRDPLLQ